jgi:signal transduction histidine kinase
MKKLTSTQALGVGFAIILALLVYSTFEAAALQQAGGERQATAHRRFVLQDDAITSARRTVWLGGIYARDYFIERTPAARDRFAAQLGELERSGLHYLSILRQTSPARFQELELESVFRDYIAELRRIASPGGEALSPPTIFIEEVVIPRRLGLLSLFEDFRTTVRRELVDAQTRYDGERAAAAGRISGLLLAALFLGGCIAVLSIRYASRLERDRQASYEAIAVANRELENLSARLLEIQEQERRSLSQELHDEVGQTLTALRMEISQSIPRVSDPDVAERLSRARQLAESTVQIVRDISLMLRPSLLDDLGLGAALQWQLERFSSRSGIDYRFDGAEVGEHLPDGIKTCVFRIAQEALNNCEKYAGAASVHVVLRHQEGRVSLEVSDDGCGFTTDRRGLPSRGTGILGMKERAQTLGGSVTVDSRPGAGTRIALILPIPADTPQEAHAVSNSSRG